MMKLSNKWQSSRWGDDRREEYPWQEIGAGGNDYQWLKKIVIASVIFMIVYLLHQSDTTFGRITDETLKYTLSTQTDCNYIIEQLVSHSPSSIDLSVLKKVQMVISKPADPLIYMSKPVEGKIISPFGWRVHPISKQEMMHEGIDIEATLGTNVRAVAAGKVKGVTESAQYGKMIILEHSQEIETIYGHLGEIMVAQGDLISQGQVIGRVGKTGMVTGSLLYFELREKGKAIDPETRLKGDFSKGEGK